MGIRKLLVKLYPKWWRKRYGAELALVVPRWRGPLLRGVGITLLGLAAVYLVSRGVAELFVIDFADPRTYRPDWGGPSLVGVLAVHIGPAALVIAGVAVYLVRRRKAGRSRQARASPEQASTSR